MEENVCFPSTQLLIWIPSSAVTGQVRMRPFDQKNFPQIHSDRRKKRQKEEEKDGNLSDGLVPSRNRDSNKLLPSTPCTLWFVLSQHLTGGAQSKEKECTHLSCHCRLRTEREEVHCSRNTEQTRRTSHFEATLCTQDVDFLTQYCQTHLWIMLQNHHLCCFTPSSAATTISNS